MRVGTLHRHVALAATTFLMTLTAGCADDGKRPIGASCEIPAECESGACFAGLCIDPDGQPLTARYHILDTSWGVQQVGAGSMTAGHTPTTDLTFTRTGGQTTLRIGAECQSFGAVFMRGGAEFTDAAARCEPADPEDTVPVRAQDEGIILPGFENDIDETFFGVGGIDPFDPATQAFVGYGEWTEEVLDRSTREVVFVAVAKASEDASLAALAGEFGVVRFLMEAATADQEVLLDVAHFAATIADGPDGGTLTVAAGGGAGFGFVRQSPADTVLANTDTPDAGGQPEALAFTVTPTGLLTLQANPIPIRGMMTPSGDLFFLGGGEPGTDDLKTGDDIAIRDPARLQFEMAVGVRRSVRPELAGKIYSLIRHAVTAEPGFFSFERQPLGAALVFDEDGQTATLTLNGTFASVSTGPDPITEGDLEPETLTLTVSAPDGDGLITMTSTEEDQTFEVFGFQSVNREVLVLGDRRQLEVGGAIGMSFGRCGNCGDAQEPAQ